jgi:ATP-dependent Clp protease adaptor protein ClpS
MMNFLKLKLLTFVPGILITRGRFERNDCPVFRKEKQVEMKTAYQEELLVDVLEATETIDVMDLIVFNDDINTFDHVIHTLIRVCKHTPEQAEQCTLLIHYKGKCAVKTGTFDFLKPMREAICEAGIDARIL